MEQNKSRAYWLEPIWKELNETIIHRVDQVIDFEIVGEVYSRTTVRVTNEVLTPVLNEVLTPVVNELKISYGDIK